MADNERKEIEISRGKIGDDKGRDIHYRVYKRTFQNAQGRPFSQLSFELFEVVRFVRKTDNRDGTKKVGDQDVFKNNKLPMSRMKDAIQLLKEVDRQFNESRGFGDAVVKETQQDFIDDDVPF